MISKLSTSHKPQTIFGVLVLGVVYLFILVRVLSPDTAWIHPEVIRLETFILNDPHMFLKQVFNWDQMEYAPRLTRPISSLVQIADAHLRSSTVSTLIPIFPSLSICWLFTLVLSPLFLFGICRSLALDGLTSTFVLSMFLMSPNSLYQDAMVFRPAKCLAQFFLIATIYFCLKLNEKTFSFKRVFPVFISALLGLLSDELGVLGFLFTVYYFWRSSMHKIAPKTFASLFFIPVGLYILYAKVFMAIAFHLWGIRAAATDYFIFDPILRQKNAFAQVGDTLLTLARNFALHLKILFNETFGLSFVGISESPYRLAFSANAVSISAFVAYCMYKNKNSGRLGCRNTHDFLFMAVFCTLVHTVFMALTGSKIFGPYYYAGGVSLFWILAAGRPLAAVHPIYRLATVAISLFCMSALFFATNTALRNFHYYPEFQAPYSAMFLNDTNRFAIRSPFEAKGQIDRLIELSPHQCTDVPNEYIWVLHELKWRTDISLPSERNTLSFCRQY